jgi:hypothetical protein
MGLHLRGQRRALISAIIVKKRSVDQVGTHIRCAEYPLAGVVGIRITYPRRQQ